jgi:hypothetical protein
MWFAALGSYEQNPWLVHLLYKLLLPYPEVDISRSDSDVFPPGPLSLLDITRYPFSPERPPVSVRVLKYEYDFTRWDSPWAREQPYATMLLSNGTCAIDLSREMMCLSSDDHNNRSNYTSTWWRRRLLGEYLPALDLSNESLKKFLSSQRFSQGGYVPTVEAYSDCLHEFSPLAGIFLCSGLMVRREFERLPMVREWPMTVLVVIVFSVMLMLKGLFRVR